MADKTIRVANAILLALIHGQLPSKLVIGMLAVKLLYVDSIIRNASVRKLASLLHCGKDTAAEILNIFSQYDGFDFDENKNINVWAPLHHYDFKEKCEVFEGHYFKKKIGGSQKLYVRNNKVYIQLDGKESKGYTITYRNLKKILLMLAEVNLLKQVKRLQDQESRGCKSRSKKHDLNTGNEEKTMMSGKRGCSKKNYPYKHGISFETMAEKLNVSLSTVKKITKEMALTGLLAISNATNFQEPYAVMDYDKVRALSAIRADKVDYKSMSPVDAFKRQLMKEDPTLVAHRQIIESAEREGYKTIKSFTTTKLGSDGEMHSYRYYYVMCPNQYECLV